LLFLIIILNLLIFRAKTLADATPQPSPALNFWRPPGGPRCCSDLPNLPALPQAADAAEATSLSFDEIFVMIVC
jgi:hypothetical protein